ncbi:putative pentatricopeptide repeat protein [Daldinia childiae]|uniref:putative pentatricopeptide repeat protein n=1 Tax=Daldinia childiae TaxID=326645 RepID=UPI0014480DC3|nr:putative pentatricopeptide repeat protein [Daldinia childiae]KAF3064564.1 putative pentatricopeptide repeat protein [Daldinia childiae]
MFTCKSCKRKAFSTLINPTFRLQNTLATVQPIYTPALSRRHRKYTTTTAPANVSQQDGYQDNPKAKRKQTISPQEWAAQKQLQYLKDPLHIQDYVRKTLERGNFDDAMLITKKASKNSVVTVSWNHLIGYVMQQGKLHAGIKLYNDMKKIGQFPNAQTYTIIFKGCSFSPHPKLAVSEAIRIYNNMLTNDRITPNTIHLNAVLKVCANAEDIESLFTIVQTANQGLRAPNNLTYTIILNALRRKVNRRQYGLVVDVDTPKITKAKARTILRSKAIWEEVISKWRAGSIIIDEELVCAMGWILLMGNYHDAESIEALLEQTMMIPKDDVAAIRGESKKWAGHSKDDIDAKPATTVDTDKIKAPGAPEVSHALPGNNSLSLIIAALEKSGKTSRAQAYWDIFTKKHHVVPDANNWHRMLMTLRRGKNSSQTVMCLWDMPAELMLPKNFRTAMNTCLRDNLNTSVFNNATEVVKIMLSKLKIPDPITLRNYLRVAYACKRPFFDQFGNDTYGATMAWSKQLATALENLWKPYMTVARQYDEDGPESNMKRELVALARKMIAASDRVISSNVLRPGDQKEVEARRNSLNRVVVRHFKEMKEMFPEFRPEEDAKEEDEGDKDGEDGEDGEDGDNHKRTPWKYPQSRPMGV